MDYTKTDQNISKFLDEWYNKDINDYLSTLKIGLTKEILSHLSKEESLHAKKTTIFSGYRNNRNILWSLKKTFWFLLWSCKWFVFVKIIQNKKVLIAAVGSNLNNTREYLDQLSAVAKQNNFVTVFLNISESLTLFRTKGFFYFPRFFYNQSSLINQKNSSLYAKEIFDEIQTLAEKNDLKVSLTIRLLNNAVQSLVRDYNSFSFLANEFLLPDNIIGLVQDYDYTYNKFIYYKVAAQKGIKTITLDTSLVLYQHLYRKVYSDYHLIWGEHKREFLLKNNSIETKKIFVIGKPIQQKKISKNNNPEPKIWLYIAQAYTDPSMFVSGRDFTNLKDNIHKLSAFQKKYFPDDKFILRIHPADKSSEFDFGVTISNSGSISKILDNTRIIFVEDSTLAVELISYDCPMIYIYDKYNNDNIGLVNKGIIPGLKMEGDIEETINKILRSVHRISNEFKEQMVNFYFGNYNKCNFQKVLNEVLFENKN